MNKVAYIQEKGNIKLSTHNMALSKLAQSIRYSHKATGAVKIGKKYALAARIFTI